MTHPMITIDTNNPDATKAINAFLWCMLKQRELGLVPPTEHTLAEHLFRKDIRLMLYSGGVKGKLAICMDDIGLSDEDDIELIEFFAERRRKKFLKAKAKRAPQVMVAADLYGELA